MTTAIGHYYRQFRQRDPNRTALSAYLSAKSFVAFRARLSESVAQDKRRAKAAKKGWKTRRASLH